MINYKRHKEIDFKKWDNCIESAINRNIYATTWYLDLVCKNWDALILNDYEAVMPLPWNKKWGVKYIAQPMFCQQLGVFHHSKKLDVDDFIKSIPKSFLYVNMNLNTLNGKSKFSVKENTNYELLLKDHDTLRKGYSKSHLKNLRRATRHELVIANPCDTADEFSKSKRNLALDFMTSKQFELEHDIVQTSLAFSKGEIFSVEGNDGICCSVFVLCGSKRLFLLSSYSNEESRKKGAYFFLLDYIFSLERFKGYVFDFEGSNLDGVAQINDGFGAEITKYHTVKFNFLNRFFRF